MIMLRVAIVGQLVAAVFEADRSRSTSRLSGPDDPQFGAGSLQRQRDSAPPINSGVISANWSCMRAHGDSSFFQSFWKM